MTIFSALQAGGWADTSAVKKERRNETIFASSPMILSIFSAGPLLLGLLEACTIRLARGIRQLTERTANSMAASGHSLLLICKNKTNHLHTEQEERFGFAQNQESSETSVQL